MAGPFTGHTGPINSVAFSPDGQCIVSGSHDQTIYMWNLSNLKRDMSVGFQSDDRQIVSSEDKSIYVLDSVIKGLITTTQVSFTDQSVIDDDGWICGNNGELLMWIPPLHRLHLNHPSNIWVSGSGRHETHLDLSNFVHGCGWMKCIDLS